MNGFVDFVVENWESLTVASAAVWVVVVAFVRWTKTKKDDKVIDEIQDTARKIRKGR